MVMVREQTSGICAGRDDVQDGIFGEGTCPGEEAANILPSSSEGAGMVDTSPTIAVLSITPQCTNSIFSVLVHVRDSSTNVCRRN